MTRNFYLLEHHDTRHGNGAHMCLRNCKTDYRFRFEMIVFQESIETKCQPVNILPQNIERCKTVQSIPVSTTKTSTTDTEKTTGYDEIRYVMPLSNTTKQQKMGIDAQGSPIICDGSFCNSEVFFIFQQFYCILIAIFMLHFDQV